MRSQIRLSWVCKTDFLHPSIGSSVVVTRNVFNQFLLLSNNRKAPRKKRVGTKLGRDFPCLIRANVASGVPYLSSSIITARHGNMILYHACTFSLSLWVPEMLGWKAASKKKRYFESTMISLGACSALREMHPSNHRCIHGINNGRANAIGLCKQCRHRSSDMKLFPSCMEKDERNRGLRFMCKKSYSPQVMPCRADSCLLLDLGWFDTDRLDSWGFFHSRSTYKGWQIFYSKPL